VADQVLNFFPRAQQLGEKERRFVTCSLREAMESGLLKNQTLAYFLGRTAMFLWSIGASRDHLRFRQHLPDEMAHYARDCWDAELLSSYGWIECVGHADRSAYDLSRHSSCAKARLAGYTQYAEPKLANVWTVKPNRQAIGKTLGKIQKDVISYLEALESEDVKALRDTVECNKQATLTINEQQITLTSEMISFVEVQKKVNGESFTPHVIEPSFGIGRIIYCLLEQAFDCRKEDEKRQFLHLSPVIAPFKCSILPVINKDSFSSFIQRIQSLLSSSNISSKADDSGAALGRKYARMDEIGIPFAVTIDGETEKENTVTLRERDSCRQVRLPINALPAVLNDLVALRRTWASVEAEFPVVAVKE